MPFLVNAQARKVTDRGTECPREVHTLNGAPAAWARPWRDPAAAALAVMLATTGLTKRPDWGLMVTERDDFARSLRRLGREWTADALSNSDAEGCAEMRLFARPSTNQRPRPWI